MQPEKKMKRLENRELFQDFNRTIASVLFEENTYPWEVLPKIHDFIMRSEEHTSELQSRE